MALTQVTVDQVKEFSSRNYIDVRNNSGFVIDAFKFVKPNGDYPASGIPSILAVSSISDSPIAFLLNNLASASNTSHPSSTSKAITRGRVQITGFDTSASSIGAPVYFNSSGDLTLTAGSQPIGIVLALDTNGVVYIDLSERYKYLRVLSSNPALPRNGESYFNTTINHIVSYDSARGKWLSDTSTYTHAARNGLLAAGSSFRTTDGLPTSVSPVIIERDCTLTGITASTSDLEQFVIRIDDVSVGGSGNTLAINFEAPGPTSTRSFIDLNLNQDFDEGDLLDIYILSSATGNVNNPRIKLIFKYRV